MSRSEYESRSVEESRALGARLAADLMAVKGREILLLEGPMGAGKTELVKGLGVTLGIDEAEIQSPTYSLIHEHRGLGGPLFHIDLYRLDADEVDGLGLDEIFCRRGIKAIEWWDKLGSRPPDSVLVRIEGTGEDTRSITVES